MYLVELRPGKEQLYRSVNELAAAIRCGDIDAQSRIYHRLTSRWISITLHPQFKAIASIEAVDIRPTPSPIAQQPWMVRNSASDELQIHR